MNTVEKGITGVIAIGVVTAIGLHASGLGQVVTQGFRSFGLIEKTAING